MKDWSSWISVKDKLPKKFKMVNVAGFDRPVYLNKEVNAWHYPSGLHAGFLHATNLWMPLPEPSTDAKDPIAKEHKEFSDHMFKVLKDNYGKKEEDKPQICKVCGYAMNPRGQMIVSCQCG